MLLTSQKLLDDLEWLLLSPSLLLGPFISYTPQHFTAKTVLPWIQQQEKNPLFLEFMLAKNRKRLGLYCEDLLEYFLQHHPDFELIATNQILFQEKRTIGELDFLYLHKETQEHVHLELAVKFYCGIHNHAQLDSLPSFWKQWVGPHCKDRMDLKLSKLLSKQLQSSDQEEGKECLAKHGILEVRKELLLKGRLFYPAEDLFFSDPLDSNPCHLRHLWWRVSDFFQQKNISSFCFRELSKLEWLTPLSFSKEEPVLSAKELTSFLSHYFESSERPLLMASFVFQDGGWLENSRFFIVPDHWPFWESLSNLDN